jgi:hypothetical protein
MFRLLLAKDSFESIVPSCDHDPSRIKASASEYKEIEKTGSGEREFALRMDGEVV